MARTKTVRPLTFPFLCGRFFRGRFPGVVHSSAVCCTLERCRFVVGGRGDSPHGKALAGAGSERSTATVARHAATPALADRLPLQAPRRSRTRGGIHLITVSDSI